MRLKRTISKSIGGLWGDEPAGTADDVTVVRVADFDYSNLGVSRASTQRAVPLRLRSERRLRPGDLLLEKSGGGDNTNVGRVVHWAGDRDAITSNFVNVLRSAPGFDSRFLVYLHRSLYHGGHAAACTKQTTGIQNLDLAAYLAVDVSVPAVETQRSIAAFLDRECARIDDVSAEIQRTYVLLAEVEQSHLDEAVPWTAPRPRLGWLADVRTGVTIGQRYPAATPLVSRPYLRVANVQADHLNLSEIKTVDVPADDVPSMTLENGDVLMTEGGDIDKLGRGTVWRDEIPGCLHQNHVFAVRPYDGPLCSEYLAAITRTSHARHYFESTATRSTNLASTNSTKVRAFRFPVPSLSSQLEIVRIMDSYLTSTTALRSDLDLLQRGLTEYRDALITEAVTGKLDVTKLSESQMDESLAAVREGERPEVLST